MRRGWREHAGATAVRRQWQPTPPWRNLLSRCQKAALVGPRTLQPPWASAIAIAFPIPREAPVTNATGASSPADMIGKKTHVCIVEDI